MINTNLNDITTKSISDLVAEDYRRATVFDNYKLDFCCGGKKPLAVVVEEKGLNLNAIVDELKGINSSGEHIEEPSQWDADKLTDYIISHHHMYVETNIPVLLRYLDKITTSHGRKYPDLYTLQQMFSETAGSLTFHMKKEELVLFPYAKKLIKARGEKSGLEKPDFGSAAIPINEMESDHETERKRFVKMESLTNNFEPHAGACNTIRVTYAKLREFALDLEKHFHLENNILFPKIIAMEKSLANNYAIG